MSRAWGRIQVRAQASQRASKFSQYEPAANSGGSADLSRASASPSRRLNTCLKEVLAPVRRQPWRGEGVGCGGGVWGGGEMQCDAEGGGNGGGGEEGT